MRVTIVAAFAASTNAVLHKRLYQKSTDTDLVAEKANLLLEEKQFEAKKAVLDNKLHTLGLDKEADFQKGTENEALNFQQEARKMRHQAHEKAAKMTHNEALEQLKDKLGAIERHKLAALMQKAKEQKAKDDDKAMFVKAVDTLNDMFLSAEDERTQLVVSCHAELFAIYKRMQIHIKQMDNIRADFEEAYEYGLMAVREREAVHDEIIDAYQGEDGLWAMESANAAYMQVLEEELQRQEADAALYRFIISKIEPKCGSDGKFSKKNFLQSEKDAEKKMQCQEKCAAQGKHVVNKAILSVFADPKVMEQAKETLSAHAQMSLDETLARIHRAEKEEVHSKYSFLQTASSPDMPSHLKITEAPGCGCGSLEGMECTSMLVLIGQRLECEKQDVREQEAIVNKQREDDRVEIEKQNKKILNLIKLWNNRNEMVGNQNTELSSYYQPFYDSWYKYWRERRTLGWKKWKCMKTLEELEKNTYCALKHIREYMKELTLQAWGAEPSQIVDCQYDDELSPTGECVYEGPPSEFDPDTHCFHHQVPAHGLPQQLWTREARPPFQDEELVQKMNATIALSCPQTVQSYQDCGAHLCPRDCEVGEWDEWGSCTKDCRGATAGQRTRTRKITSPARSGGARCDSTSETGVCAEEDNQPCDVDCELSDWVDFGCQTSCTNSGGPQLSIKRRHIVKEAKGDGKCWGRDDELRREVNYERCEPSLCKGDEVCDGMMDLVIGYECSQATTRVGCWFMVNFVIDLLTKMPAAVGGLPEMQVALVKFGNGYSVRVRDSEPPKYYVNPAVEISPLTNQIGKLFPKLYTDLYPLWVGGGTYKLGFNNIGVALEQAGNILDSSTREEGGTAIKKILMITQGKGSSCTTVKTVAEKWIDTGVLVDMVLFAEGGDVAAEYSYVRDAVSFPTYLHFTTPGHMKMLSSYHWAHQTATSLIPKICPETTSVKEDLKKQCDMGVQILHRGRVCHNWTKALTDGPVTLEKCKEIAIENGFKSFIHTPQDFGSDQATTGSNCATHPENGKLDPVDAEGLPLDTTCDYVPSYGKDAKDEHIGWLHQEMPPPTSDGEVPTHYRALQSRSECPQPWSKSARAFIQSNWSPEEWFKGATLIK